MTHIPDEPMFPPIDFSTPTRPGDPIDWQTPESGSIKLEISVNSDTARSLRILAQEAEMEDDVEGFAAFVLRRYAHAEIQHTLG